MYPTLTFQVQGGTYVLALLGVKRVKPILTDLAFIYREVPMLIRSDYVKSRPLLKRVYGQGLGSALYSFRLHSKRLWTEILAELGQMKEPRVWRTQDQTGQLRWSAYDPNTGQSLENLSEDEVRLWLESRYSG